VTQIRTSIVVLCYNGLEETTRPCMESIVANTPVGSYELIVVDNASADGTADYLKTFAAQHANVRIQLNDTNKGYAGGNNDGIKLAQGRYIVLLNNDTLVPQGWLERLLRLFEDQSEVGLVGPITNSAGNEQRIDLPGLNAKNYEKIAGAYIDRQQGVWFSTEKLGFYCVAMRREVPEKIGYLDELFGIGMFEDDDYCVRAKKAGYKLAVVEDCFVYHKGSVSFGKLALENYQALFSNNKVYFREKHGVAWTLTDIAFSYWDKFDRDLSACILKNKNSLPELERVHYRFENFKHLLVQVHQTEITGVPLANRSTSAHPVVSRAKWQARWHNFRRSMVYGTNVERWRYLKALSGRILNRIGNRQSSPVPNAVLIKLIEIHDALRGRKLIIFPATVDFGYMAQRPQQMARAFADNGFVVIYGTLNHKVDRVEITEKVAENLFLLHEQYFSFLSQVFKPKESIYYCLWPNNAKHLRYLPYAYLLYDYMDEISLLDLPPAELERDHMLMLERANLVTVSADSLMVKLPQHLKSKAVLINNAVSKAFIDAIDADKRVAKKLQLGHEHPILGYYGAIAEWMDFDLVDRLALELPNARIVLIGPVSDIVTNRIAETLWKYTNVALLPPCKQLDLVPFLNHFDICLIPFVKNIVTDAVSPVKLYEYFSAGKPVVTTDLAECSKYPTVNIGKNHEQFINAVKTILTGHSPNLSSASRQTALNNTWQHRICQITAAM
jgi:GT2 family glycosyltransferase/glycosyltransferase involved in cell wall biosynthesis